MKRVTINSFTTKDLRVILSVMKFINKIRGSFNEHIKTLTHLYYFFKNQISNYYFLN